MNKFHAMKNILLFTALSGSLAMVGCSSAYRTAQTPDDVYFSEGPPAREYVEQKKTPETPQEGYTSYWEKQDDNMLRMKVNDRDKWNAVDDIDYWQGYNNNYWVNYNSPWSSPWSYNPYTYNPHTFYNPWGMNRGWGMNSSIGWNSWGIGYNSWYNNWSNPYCWNQPVKVINRYPVGASSRSATALTPYSNYSYNRGSNTLKNRMNVNPGASRSIFEGSNFNTTDRSGNSMYRTINRSGINNGSSGSSYERPTRTFDSGGSSSGGSSRSSGTSSGSSSGGTSSGSGGSRGGRGG
jgi:hypothetical protein